MRACLPTPSVTAWAAVEECEPTGRIEDAARRLGLRSPDSAANVIGHAWRTCTDANGLEDNGA
ncbi:hypothetical protein [Streptomyces sp. NPDC096311]|uniref:hypothetical protein n=1 Tax=Streptomyces sp. NPDC096311 TaxID=3366083 RepID=UPI00381877FD